MKLQTLRLWDIKLDFKLEKFNKLLWIVLAIISGL